jgi:hypothetical protein
VRHVDGPVVITAVRIEGQSKSEVARVYGVSRVWVQKLIHRFEADGERSGMVASRSPQECSENRAGLLWAQAGDSLGQRRVRANRYSVTDTNTKLTKLCGNRCPVLVPFGSVPPSTTRSTRPGQAPTAKVESARYRTPALANTDLRRRWLFHELQDPHRL